MVLRDVVDVFLPDAQPDPESVSIQFASKDAYGCGEHGKQLLEGITLHVRRLGYADLGASLSIGLSLEALRIIQENLDVPEKWQGLDDEVLPMIDVDLATEDGQVLFLKLRFWRDALTVIYYLVYDSKDASLYMIPNIPGRTSPILSRLPVALPRAPRRRPGSRAGPHGERALLHIQQRS